MGLELGQDFGGRKGQCFLPAVDGDAVAQGIDSDDDVWSMVGL